MNVAIKAIPVESSAKSLGRLGLCKMSHKTKHPGTYFVREESVPKIYCASVLQF